MRILLCLTQSTKGNMLRMSAYPSALFNDVILKNDIIKFHLNGVMNKSLWDQNFKRTLTRPFPRAPPNLYGAITLRSI